MGFYLTVRDMACRYTFFFLETVISQHLILLQGETSILSYDEMSVIVLSGEKYWEAHQRFIFKTKYTLPVADVLSQTVIKSV